ncbi:MULTISPECIES: hypothetical protein [unclassified Okeania]|uniref:DUF7219 family protein n=1 Tax=unclassified Okeania TaxID=2634635 RepID=UPI00338EA3A6
MANKNLYNILYIKRKNKLKIFEINSGKAEMKKDEFLYPQSPYYGQATPANINFNAKLQEFSHKINYISGLQTSGKISTTSAYLQIQELWEQLEKIKKDSGFSQQS